MTSKALKRLKRLSAEGKFKELRAALLEGEVDIDTNEFLEVLLTCGWFCKKITDKESIEYNELFSFLKLKAPMVRDLPGADLEKYLRCLYHCLASPFKEEYFDDLQTLQNILLPRCTASTSSPVYSSFAKVVHSTIRKTPSLGEKLAQIYVLMLKLCKAAQDSELMLNVTTCMFLQTFEGKLNVERQEECYRSFIDVSKGMDFDQQKLVNTLAPIITKIMSVHMKSHDFSHIQTFLGNLRDDFEYEQYQHLWNVVNFIVVLFPMKLDCKDKILNASMNSIKKVTLKSYVITDLHAMVKVILKYYKEKEDCYELTGELQIKVLTFLYTLSKIVSTDDTVTKGAKCTCGCTAKTSTVMAVICFEAITLLIDFSLDSSPDHVTYLNILSKYSNEITHLKENNCVYLAGVWGNFGTALINFGERSNNSKYIVMLIKNYFKLQSRRVNITTHNLVSKMILSFCQYVSEDPNSILSFCALASHLSPFHRRQFLPLWLKTKYNLRNQSSEMTTMVRAIELLDWPKFGVNVALTVDDQVELLIYELELYKKSWQSKVSMMAALKELYMTADCSKVAEVAVRVFGECDLPVHGEVVKIINSITGDYKTKAHGIEEKLYLSKLYFMSYKYRLIENGHKTCMEIEANMSIKPLKNEAATSDITDSEDECDVVSSYSSLRLDRCVEEWNYLDKSLELIEAQSKKTCLSKFPDLNLYDLLMKIAFEYQMNCHHLKTIQALELALKIAQSQDNPSNVIRTVSYLLRISTKWLTVGEQFLPLLDPKDTKVLVTYYIYKAEAYLRRDDVQTSYETFKLASDLLQNEEIEHGDFIRCRLLLLELRYMNLPCDAIGSISHIIHGGRTLARSRKAYEAVLSRMKTTPLDTETLSTVFDFVEGLAAFHHRMREPRAVRRYASNVLILAQKMVLPSRCATLLAYLAFADVHTGRYDDCYEKLSGMSDVLVLPKRKARAVADSERDAIVDEMRRMSLDAGGDVPRRCLDESPSRYFLSVERMEMPPSCRHAKSCECFYCVCLEYQVWVLMAIRLDLVYNLRERSQTVVGDLRRNADYLYDRYMENCQNRSLKTIHDYVKSKFVIGYCYILLDHARFLMATGHRQTALDTIDKLSKIVAPIKTECCQLYGETLVMKLIVKYQALAPSPSKPATTSFDTEDADIATDENLSTPIGHKHAPPAEAPQFAFASPEPLKRIRVPKLIFSPEKKAPETPKLRTPRPKRLQEEFKTPKPKELKDEFKTPKPKELKEDFKTPRPKELEEEPQTPVIWIDPPDEAVAESATKSTRRRGRRNEEPESATRQTRSKLLVEKLKSAKKSEREEHGSSEAEAATNSMKKLRPRKNLMF